MFESSLTYRLGDRQISRMGYGTMQLSGPGVYGPPPNILLIPGTSSPHHLRENMASLQLTLPADALAKLNAIAAPSV